MDTEPPYGSQYNAGDIGFVIVSMSLVWLMIPGIGYFYSGLARSKNALSMIMSAFLCLVVVSVQWFIWGYSLAFSDTGSVFIGNVKYAFFRDVLGDPSPGSDNIPAIVFCIYQAMFAALTPALAIGSAAERARLLPMIIFIFVWSTIVYDVLACWTWNPNGWSYQLGGLDFAGGTPVHIASGFSSLAYALILGKRTGKGSISQEHEFKPHNMSNVVLGTALLWFGWFGFNGGSALSANLRAGMACVVTNLAASVGAITWMILDYRIDRKFSALGFCSGAISGLVAITPAAGFVGPGPAVAIGFFGGVFCNLASHMKEWLRFDDALDVFAVHGVGGYVGCIFTGVFAEKYIASLDGTEIDGGWMNRNWIQVGYQFADATAGAVWSFFITYLILFIMDKIPGLSLRVSQEVELEGLDAAEIGEQAYAYHINKIVTVDPETGEQKVVREEVSEVPQQNHNAQGSVV